MEKKLEDETFDDVLYALSNRYQRELLLALLEHNPQDDRDHDPLNLLSETEEAEVFNQNSSTNICQNLMIWATSHGIEPPTRLVKDPIGMTLHQYSN